MHFKSLFSPLKIGPITVPNRIFMAPMTRARSAEPGDVPTPLMAEYYRQRASAGLIITEATQISFDAKGWAGAPGVHTPEQIEAWRKINQGIRSEGGHSAVQVWHTGRISHPSLRPGNATPVAPSAVQGRTRVRLRDEEGKLYIIQGGMPRALTIPEIHAIVQDFGQAAANAREAGFDLVELHGAHGYLVQQFLSPTSNLRTDEYGGSVENRSRFALEVADAAIAKWDASRIGFRVFPMGQFNGIEGSDSQAEDSLYLIKELAKRNLAYLHVSEPDWAGGEPLTDEFRQAIRDLWPGVIIGAGGYTPEKAEDLISRGLIDAAAFGRSYISNPDLVERIRVGAPLAPVRETGVYGGDAEGYTDYPVLNEELA